MVLVWMIVYRVLVLIKRTGTIQMLSGLGVLAIGYLFSHWLEIYTFNWILEKFFGNLFIIVVVLFQAEIRRALAHIGSNPFFTEGGAAMEGMLIEEIAKGISSVAERGYGALIVVEHDIAIDYHIEMGTELDALVSPELITSLFHPSSPVHDGALLIRNGRAFAAGCFLPLSKNPALDKNLGTRHRAALGLTEESDALVFVVSEENKSIGIVQGGHLRPHVEVADVRRALYDLYGLKYKGYVPSEGVSS
jgi:diadenylate cyclase